ncbi:MAG: GxxExxY protein [Bacillota bacterium]
MGGLLHASVTKEILGAAFAVHKELGPGFLETVYEAALMHELTLRKIPFARQVRIPIKYKNIMIGEHVLDLIVDDKVVVELKAIAELADVHTSVVISYLAATKLRVALLINFGKSSLEFKRIAREQGKTR